MGEYIDAKALESGTVLLYLKHSFLKKRSSETLFPVLSCLRDSQVIVPMNVIMSKEDEEMFQNLKAGDTVSTREDIRLKPDILQNGEHFFFPMFSNAEQIPKEYGTHFSTINVSVLQCIEMAKSYKHASGLVLDAFTEPLVLEYEIADIIPQLESRLAPEE